MIMENLYLSTAQYYDIDMRHLTYHDIDFYLNYARRQKGAILEIACGTGRVTIPLAKAGYAVHGIDLSIPMLSILKRKLGELPPEVSRRITVVQADMARFDLKRRFELIIIPFRAFQALTTDETVRAALLCVKSHLAEDGLFILDVFKPRWKMDESWVSTEEEFDWVKQDEATGKTIIRASVRRSIDTRNQIVHPEIIYYIEDGSGSRERICEPLSLRYYYQYQMEVLLITLGFTIVETFGYYDGRSTEAGSELIFVCRATRGGSGIRK